MLSKIKIRRRRRLCENRIKRVIACESDEAIFQHRARNGTVRLLEQPEAFSIALDVHAVPVLVRHQIPCVAEMLAVPGAEFDTPLICCANHRKISDQ